MIRKRVLRSKRRINRKALRSKRKTSNKRIRKKSIRRRQKGGALQSLTAIKHYTAHINTNTKIIDTTKGLLTKYINERWGLWGYIYNICSNVHGRNMSPDKMTEMSKKLTSYDEDNSDPPKWKPEYDIFTPLTPTNLGIIHDANGCHMDQKKINFIKTYYDYFKELFTLINNKPADWSTILNKVNIQLKLEPNLHTLFVYPI
jgi:hypothetical protein